MRILIKYLLYLVSARHRKGHGIHSPFVFDLVSNVLYGTDKQDYTVVEARRKYLLKDRSRINVEDYGAGSRTGAGEGREVRHIAKTSAIRSKYGRLLTRLVSWYKPSTIIELGTGFGISTAYLAIGCPGSGIYSIEGSGNIHDMARETMQITGLKNVELIHGQFAGELRPLLEKTVNKKNFLVFIDGDHVGKNVLEYCEWLEEKSFEDLVIILDDIYWSPSMAAAWKELVGRTEFTVSIDLFQFGILFVKKGVAKQHYMIRF